MSERIFTTYLEASTLARETAQSLGVTVLMRRAGEVWIVEMPKEEESLQPDEFDDVPF